MKAAMWGGPLGPPNPAIRDAVNSHAYHLLLATRPSSGFPSGWLEQTLSFTFTLHTHKELETGRQTQPHAFRGKIIFPDSDNKAYHCSPTRHFLLHVRKTFLKALKHYLHVAPLSLLTEPIVCRNLQLSISVNLRIIMADPKAHEVGPSKSEAPSATGAESKKAAVEEEVEDVPDPDEDDLDDLDGMFLLFFPLCLIPLSKAVANKERAWF